METPAVAEKVADAPKKAAKGTAGFLKGRPKWQLYAAVTVFLGVAYLVYRNRTIETVADDENTLAIDAPEVGYSPYPGSGGFSGGGFGVGSGAYGGYTEPIGETVDAPVGASPDFGPGWWWFGPPVNVPDAPLAGGGSAPAAVTGGGAPPVAPASSHFTPPAPTASGNRPQPTTTKAPTVKACGGKFPLRQTAGPRKGECYRKETVRGVRYKVYADGDRVRD